MAEVKPQDVAAAGEVVENQAPEVIEEASAVDETVQDGAQDRVQVSEAAAKFNAEVMSMGNPYQNKSAGQLKLVSEFGELAQIQKEFAKSAQLTFVRNTVAKSMNDQEIFMFLFKAQKMGFNPLTGEVIGYMANDRENNTKSLVMIPTRDGKRRKAYERAPIEYIRTRAIYRLKVAEQTKETVDGKEKISMVNKYVLCEPWEGGELWGATSEIKRADIAEPFVVTVPIDEYDTNQKAWTKKKDTMIKKVAESQCLSAAVPELGGLYEAEELSNVYEPAVDTISPDSTLPAADNDNEEISPAVAATIQAMAKKSGEDVDTTGWTQRQGREYIEKMALGKGKK